MENHRTNTEYEDALIMKTFGFQFINNFGAYIYMGFIQEYESMAALFQGPNGCVKGCIRLLGSQIFYVFLFKLIGGNIQELLSGYFFDLYYYKKCKKRQIIIRGEDNVANNEGNNKANNGIEIELINVPRKKQSKYMRLDPNEQENVMKAKKEDVKRNPTENVITEYVDKCIVLEPVINQEGRTTQTISCFDDIKLSNEVIRDGDKLVKDFVTKHMYSVTERTNDYMELVILFGYTSLFVVAEPVIVPIALVSICFECMIDSQKLKNNFLRPFPQKVEDIGMIWDIFNFVAWLSAFSNMYLGAFITRTTYMDFILRKYGRAGQFALFILAEHLILLFKVLLSVWVSKVPNEIAIQKERQEFIQSKLFSHSQFSITVAVEQGAKSRRQSALKDQFNLKLHKKYQNSELSRNIDVSLGDESACAIM
eukprot:g4694.t1